MDEPEGGAVAAVSDAGGGDASAVRVRIDYHGDWDDIAGIAIRNALLSVVTLGIYSFWGRTEIRRYLWSRTTINRPPLEYTGTGLQIFLGFVFVALVFAGINVVASILQTALIGGFGTGQSVEILVVVPGIAIFLILNLAWAQFLRFRVRRYLLRQTAWNGIHLRQGGSNRVMLGKSLLWSAITVLTLGLAYPLLVTRAEGYAYSNAWLGDRRFGYRARTRQLLADWALAIMLPVVAVGAIVVYRATTYLTKLMSGTSDPGQIGLAINALMRANATTLVILYIVFALGMVFCFAYWRAALFNISVSALSLGPLRFSGRITAWRFASAYLRYAGLAVLFVTTAVVLVTIASTILGIGLGPLAKLLGGTFGVALVLVIQFLLFLAITAPLSVLYNVVMVHGLWKARVDATDIDGLLDPGTIRQAQLEHQTSGEGLGQFFDAGIGEI